MYQKQKILCLPLLSLAACGLPTVNDMPPAKVQFAADHSMITAGDTVRVSWTSKDASGCTITANGVTVSSEKSGTVDQQPDKTTVYAANCSGKKSGSATLTITVLPLPIAKIAASEAQIYLGNSTELSWSCENSEKANLTVNGEAAAALSLTGTSLYSPSADTAYELGCENSIGKKVFSKAEVKVIPEVAVKPRFSSFAELDQALDVEAMKTECGAACFYADFEPQKYQKNQEGKLLATPDQVEILKNSLKLEPSKVALFTSKTVAFDFSQSFGYGHRAAVNDAAQTQLCDASFPFGKKGATFHVEPQYIDELESGVESFGAYRFPDPVVFDVEVSTKAIAGTMKAGAEALVSYKIGAASASREANFRDFDKVKGGYRLAKDGKLLSDVSADIVATRAACNPSVPDGIEVPPPPPGVNRRDYYPEPRKLSNGNYDPNDPLCRIDKRPYYKVFIEGGRCDAPYANSIDDKPGFAKQRSSRIITAFANTQCNNLFPEVAASLGLGGEWVVNSEQQFFVTDNNFPGCGSGCADKFPRNSENDWRFDNVEPARNRCVDRWAGLSWNDYLGRLSAACTSTQLYKDAVAKQAQNDNDAAFASACSTNELCRESLKAMASLSDMFSPRALSDILDREAAAMNAAKARGSSYFITEPKLVPQVIADAKAKLTAIEAGIETAQNLHAANKSGWVAANKRVHGKENIPGFDNYQQSKDTIAAYKKQFDRVSPLTDIDLREIACGYDAKGRFRKYDKPKLNGDVILTPDKQNSFKSKVKVDTKVPKA
jgi:hypothetical protein